MRAQHLRLSAVCGAFLATVLKVVKDSPEVFAGIVAVRVADGDGGVGHLGVVIDR